MAYVAAPDPKQQFFDENGDPLAGGFLYSYAAGTTTPIATFSDSSGTAHANPIVLDTAGRATIFLLSGTAYKFILRSAEGVLIWSQDNIVGPQGATIAIADNVFTLQDNSDATKLVQFQLSAIGTGTTRVFTFPNASTVLVGTDVAQTLTNKTLNSPILNGTTDVVDADGLTINDVIVPQFLEVSVHVGAAALMIAQTFFVASRAYQVIAVRFVHAVAEATAGTLRVQVVKDTSTNAPGAGSDTLTNNSNAGFDCKATANTVQTGTLTATTAALQMAAGDRLSLDFSAAATELVGVTVTVSLQRI
ncbi:MAG: hypothetical protein PHC88_05565 [Terrimicrobiaceae bacterium]|nr:hypothetical protein [Terrimicrobiaceae bacterium]